jgi:DNA-directed RNA polymerase subunit H (RpoH/RPB5)
MAGSISHALVPWHEVLTDEQARLELAPYNIVDAAGNIRLSALPPIPMDDPALLGACVPRPDGVSSEWPLNKVVRIERRSAFAGISVAYRVVSSVSSIPAAYKRRKRADQLGIGDVKAQNLELVLEDDEGIEAFELEEADSFDELDEGDVSADLKDVIVATDDGDDE